MSIVNQAFEGSMSLNALHPMLRIAPVARRGGSDAG